MTTFRCDLYNDYRGNDPMPQWMKSERYDYCDSFCDDSFLKKGNRKISRFMHFLLSAFV